MAHHLNTNKQFMRMNFILAFAVIFVVVLFVYMSLRAQQGKNGEEKYAETYRIELAGGFVGDSISLYINDSLLVNKTIDEAPFALTVNRFDKENTLIIVENISESMKLFPLSEEGGDYMFDKSGEEISLINR